MTYSSFVILNDNPSEILIPALEKELPYSLPLLRRIQYDCAHPQRGACCVASANLLTSSSASTSASVSPAAAYDTESKAGPEQEQEPWIAAFIDLHAGNETQVWVYSSLEAEVTLRNISGEAVDDKDEISDFSTISPARQDLARKQLWGLLQWIHRELMPGYILDQSTASSSETRASKQCEQEDGEEKEETKPQSKVIIPTHGPPLFLLGSLHTGLMKLITINDSYVSPCFRPGLKVYRYDVTPYVKYVFPPETYQSNASVSVSRQNGTENPLPEGYYYGSTGLQPHHVELVKSRTHIPRTSRTLLAMPSVVVYYGGAASASPENNANTNEVIVDDESRREEEDLMPIAWGFLAFDGSLATLHVEPAHRGKGIAAILSREVMRRAMMKGGVYDDDSQWSGDERNSKRALGYAHADVARENAASRRVMEKVVGGKSWAWSVTWAVVEVTN